MSAGSVPRPEAVLVAARATGLRPDQVKRAITEYRAALDALEDEPEWQALMHVSGGAMGLHQYVAEGTDVTMQIECWTERGEWRQEKRYIFRGVPHEHFAEARAAELTESARPQPYGLD